jgi:DNA repair protein RadA/Sms
MRLDSYDVFVNIAGGLRVKDPGLDLAVCLAIVSSARDRPLGLDRAFVGEVGLLGSLGRCGTLGRRLREIERAGFSEALADARSVAELGESGARPKLRLLGASDIAEAVALALPSNEEGE